MDWKKLCYPNLVYVLIIIYILGSYTVLAMGENVLNLTIREDRFFEVLGATGFILTAILCFISFIITLKAFQRRDVSWFIPVSYLSLSALFLFGGGEEISWGQRIFDIKTPEALSIINLQDELNFHNLLILDSGQFISADLMFDIFWFAFTIIIPACYIWIPDFRNYVESKIGMYTPISHWSMGILFFTNYMWAKAAKILFRSSYSFTSISFKQAVQEIKESNYGLLFVFVGLYFFLLLTQSKNSKIDT